MFWSRYIPGGGLLLSSFVTQAVPRLRRETLLLLLLVSPVRTYQHFSFKSCRECYGVLLNLTFSKIQNGYLAPISYINIVFLSEYYSQVSFFIPPLAHDLRADLSFLSSLFLPAVVSAPHSPCLSKLFDPVCLFSFYNALGPLGCVTVTFQYLCFVVVVYEQCW